MIKTRSRHPRRKRMAIAALAVVAGCTSALGAMPGSAGAAEAPLCGGTLELNNEIPGIDPPGGLSYKFNCNAQVQGYSIVSNRQVDYFSTEVLVLDAAGNATNESFGCEGTFPSSGFGCRGLSNFGNAISGEFAIGRDPCQAAKAKSDKFKVWVSATVQQFDSITSKPFTAVTQPFRLKAPECKTSKTSKEARR